MYNVKDYLVRCVESAVFQTYKNIEIILVDDGSTDGSDKVCDELAKKYKKVQALHKENGGLSDARNFGMDHMTGDYFFFLDSDDYINSNALQLMYSVLVALNLDIVECEYKEVKDLKRVNYYFNDFIVRKDSVKSFIFQTIKWKEHYGVAWNKLYSTKAFGKYRFQFGKINEDEFFVNEWLGSIKKIGYISAPLYYYTIRSNSIMQRPYTIKRVDGIQAYVNRFNVIKTIEPTVVDDYLAYIANYTCTKLNLVASQNSDADNSIKMRIASVLSPIKDLLLNAGKVGPTNKGILNDLFTNYLKEE